jgi:hypothetical protein
MNTFLILLPSGFEFLAVSGLIIIPFIFYLLTLQKTLQAVSPENRKLDPGLVWLMFIPVFNLVWHFIIINRVADSVQAQLNKGGVNVRERPAFGIGLAMCILFCCCWMPVISMLTGPAALICWIIYWVKISEFKRKVEVLGMNRSDDDFAGNKY